MSAIATPQEIHVDHDGKVVRLTIQGVGTLGLPAATAHKVARQLVGCANEVEQLMKPWPYASRR